MITVWQSAPEKFWCLNLLFSTPEQKTILKVQNEAIGENWKLTGNVTAASSTYFHRTA